MKFGSVDNPELINFELPSDHANTKQCLEQFKTVGLPHFYIGCAKWNRADLKGFYPRGTKDELEYYSTQFNSIELNATFYRIFSPEQFSIWYNKTPEGFRFFPKLFQEISHWKRLNEVGDVVKTYLFNVSNLKEKLGTIFLQMHSNFTPKDFNRVVTFVEQWPKNIALGIEFRHPNWYNDPTVSQELYNLLETNNISNIIVDTAGKRELMHMRLTNNTAFVRYVGANHKSDYSRLDDWVDRLEEWCHLGLKEINFFIHQNLEKESPLLASYFINSLNNRLGADLNVPNKY